MRGQVRRGIPLLVGLVALMVYLLTLAPDLTWEHNGSDGGDLIASSYAGGAAHPPGYPVYSLLGRAAAWALRVPAIVHTVHGAPFYPYQSAVAPSSVNAPMRSSAPRTFSSHSFSSGVTNRSPPTVVCLRV